MQSLFFFLAILPFSLCQSASDLNFKSITHESGNVKLKFSVALPEVTGRDFIGQIECASSGWCGIALGPRMIGSLLLPVWVNQGKVVSSLRWIYRETPELQVAVGSDINNYTSPISLETYKRNFTAAIIELYPTFLDPKFKKYMPDDNLPYDAAVRPIPALTSITDTSLKFTFLCTRCITGNELTAAFQDGNFGFAAAQVLPPNPEDPNGKLQYHFGISGVKQLDLAKAKSPNFAKVAALAS